MSNLEPATILLIDDHPMLRTACQHGARYYRCRRSQQW